MLDRTPILDRMTRKTRELDSHVLSAVKREDNLDLLYLYDRICDGDLFLRLDSLLWDLHFNLWEDIQVAFRQHTTTPQQHSELWPTEEDDDGL